jgi:hypothetical protein
MAPIRERGLRGRLAATGTFVIIVALSTVASAAAQTRTLKPERRSGGWQERVPVSGGIRVGVVVWQEGHFKPQEVALVLPSKPAGSPALLCVELSSRDGRYNALLEYPIANDPGGPITALVDAPQLDKLNTAAGEDVAILASLSDDCRAQSPSVYLVAAWRPSKSPASISILLNSRVPTTIVGENVSAQCTELPGVTTAYNLRCDLPAQLPTGRIELGIRQQRGRGRVTVPLPLIVAR